MVIRGVGTEKGEGGGDRDKGEGEQEAQGEEDSSEDAVLAATGAIGHGRGPIISGVLVSVVG